MFLDLWGLYFEGPCPPTPKASNSKSWGSQASQAPNSQASTIHTTYCGIDVSAHWGDIFGSPNRGDCPPCNDTHTRGVANIFNTLHMQWIETNPQAWQALNSSSNLLSDQRLEDMESSCTRKHTIPITLYIIPEQKTSCQEVNQTFH